MEVLENVTSVDEAFDTLFPEESGPGTHRMSDKENFSSNRQICKQKNCLIEQLYMNGGYTITIGKITFHEKFTFDKRTCRERSSDAYKDMGIQEHRRHDCSQVSRSKRYKESGRML